MADTPDQAKYTVQLPVSDWLLIDGTMDNHVQSAIEDAVPDGVEEGEDPDEENGWDEGPDWDGDGEPEATDLPPVARLGTSIRQAGWDQIPGWPRDVKGFETWPAPGQLATMTLTGAQWELVLFALRCWADVDERISDAEGAAESRAIAAAVERRLAERGWAAGSKRGG